MRRPPDAGTRWPKSVRIARQLMYVHQKASSAASRDSASARIVRSPTTSLTSDQRPTSAQPRKPRKITVTTLWPTRRHHGPRDFSSVTPPTLPGAQVASGGGSVSYTHLRAHETDSYLV